MLAALCAAIEHRRSTHRYRYALLAGMFAGLAILTRANGAVLLLPLVLAVWTPRTKKTLGPPLAMVAIAILTVMPWTIRNAVEMHAFVPVSTQLGSALAGTYNDQARHDEDNPWSWRSIRHIPEYRSEWRSIRDVPEVDLEKRLRRKSRDYIADHPFSVAEVGFWNTYRLLDLPGLGRARATAATVGIDREWADRTVWCFWAFALLAIAGALTARARKAPFLVWLTPLLLVASVVFLTTETPRYRTAVEPFVVLLATLAVVSAARWSGRPRRTSPRPLPDAPR
jgi:4-amino-4-deoxy-L-arabinose transferase-like glycosyltransferase